MTGHLDRQGLPTVFPLFVGREALEMIKSGKALAYRRRNSPHTCNFAQKLPRPARDPSLVIVKKSTW